MAEWLKAQHWKCCIRATLSRVRIPLSPFYISLYWFITSTPFSVKDALKNKGYALLCVAKATSDLELETTYEDEVYDLQFGQYFGRGNTRVAPPWEFEED